MTFADSTRPAYTVVISALPSQVQPAMNKRNIVLIQRYFEQMLKIPASRGFVRFVATAEECCGCNMRTVASEIAEYTSPDADDGRGPRPAKVRNQYNSFLSHLGTYLPCIFHLN